MSNGITREIKRFFKNVLQTFFLDFILQVITTHGVTYIITVRDNV